MFRIAIVTFCAAAVLAVAALAQPSLGTAAVREFEGRGVSVNPAAGTFRMRDHHRGIVRIKVTRSTRFEELRGLSSLRAGLRV